MSIFETLLYGFVELCRIQVFSYFLMFCGFAILLSSIISMFE